MNLENITITMSDNDNYWSDENESENELIQDSRDLPPLEYDSEEEEEFLIY